MQLQWGTALAAAVLIVACGSPTSGKSSDAGPVAHVPSLGAPASPNNGVYLGATMALNPVNGFPVIAYRDEKGDGHVQKWLGTAWSTDMGVFNSESMTISGNLSANLSLAVDSAGQPVVAYIDSTDSKARVARWDGSAWIALESAGGATDESTQYLSLGVGPYQSALGPNFTDVPFLASTSQWSNQPHFAGSIVFDTAFDPDSWASPEVGAAHVVGPNAAWVSLVMNPYYETDSGRDYAFFASAVGTTLTIHRISSYDTDLTATVSGASFVSLGLDQQGLFYVAYVDGAGTARLLQQSASTLIEVATIGKHKADDLSMVFDPRPGMKTAYVSLRDVSTGKAALWKWDNGVGSLLYGDVSGSGARVQGTKLVMSSSGHLYYLYECEGEAVVKDFAR